MMFLNTKIEDLIYKILSDIFYVSLVTFIFFSLIELISARFITAFINMNALLMIVFITGIITILKNK